MPWRQPVCSEPRGGGPGEDSGCGAAGRGFSLRLPWSGRALSSASPEAVGGRAPGRSPKQAPPPPAGPAPARFGSRLVREDVLFLQAATPCSLGFTPKRGFRRPVKLPHPLWGVPHELPPLAPLSLFHPPLTVQLFPTQATPCGARARPSSLGAGLENPATSSHLPCAGHRAPRPSLARAGAHGPGGQAGYGQRRWPTAPGQGSSQRSALRLREEQYSPPGYGGPLQRAGAAGRQLASDPAETWQGRCKRCLREGAAETRRDARAGRSGREGSSGGAGGRAREAAFPTQPRARAGAPPCPAGSSPSCPLLAAVPAVAVRGSPG